LVLRFRGLPGWRVFGFVMVGPYSMAAFWPSSTTNLCELLEATKWTDYPGTAQC
jgi:hypothetical protein